MLKNKFHDLIVWDFNGTILNDTEVSLNAINSVLSKRNMNTLQSVEKMREVFCFPCEEYYKRLGFDFKTEPYETPSKEWIDYYNSHIFDSTLYEGVIETLKHIKSLGITQVILSASDKTILLKQIDKFDLKGYFHSIIGVDDYLAKGKSKLISSWLSAHEYISPIFIGDTEHDLKCAVENDADCVLFSNGFISKERLLNFGVPVIDRISDFIQFIN